jgi:hypothetical protein
MLANLFPQRINNLIKNTHAWGLDKILGKRRFHIFRHRHATCHPEARVLCGLKDLWIR